MVDIPDLPLRKLSFDFLELTVWDAEVELIAELPPIPPML
eukprot:CAMPEP_0171313590 /NCGR_PEP_ID=MMETSP0816-20121228/44064_1 /TAXON_ID=420281 /ORGANISM="Proboscia inermis, Strain CCAP1064/1" /LENGTH=39 /DNA_ID= /DNA_START= /DNA_END= /DNA_ORIENTATION=